MARRLFWNQVTVQDMFAGIVFGIWHSKSHLVRSYGVIPIGIIILFMVLYGLNQLLVHVFKVKFPASVLGMLINLIFLVILNLLTTISSDSTWLKKIKDGSSWVLTTYMRIIKPSMNFSLKWINVFFIPSFIILPLSDPISFIECLKIAGVFIGGWIALILIDIYFIQALRWLLPRIGLSYESHQQDSHVDDDVELQTIESNNKMHDITTIDLASLIPAKTEISEKATETSVPGSKTYTNPFKTPSIFSEITEPQPLHHRPGEPMYKPRNDSDIVESSSASTDTEPEPEQQLAQVGSKTDKTDSLEGLNESTKTVTIFVTLYIDWIIYGVMFIISLPLYYVSSLHIFLPYHLGITIIAYYLALLIPQKWPWTKNFAHPILILTAEILFVCFIGSLIYHHGKPEGFLNDLKFYRTGKNYLNLFNNKIMVNNGKESTIPTRDYTATPKWPGCGDVLSSLMDISIVALSLPMFTHRRDFIKNFWVLMPPILVSIALTFLLYPIVCYHIGIEPARSIGFIGRSVTLALGTPLILALDGSVSLMAVCTILSGICGVLVGDVLFKVLRVSVNDYVTRGVSLGINCGAIATAHLLNSDPRAASMSSLSFSIFGTIMVIMSSIGSISQFIKSLVGW